MNIDVREYLRVNPISVHELTLSGDGKDCFLYFPAKDNDDGYLVYTQKTVFWSLYKSILGNLIGGDEDNYYLNADVSFDNNGNLNINWDDDIELVDGQFSDYVKRSAWQEYK